MRTASAKQIVSSAVRPFIKCYECGLLFFVCNLGAGLALVQKQDIAFARHAIP
jgi:hypothetical protein